MDPHDVALTAVIVLRCSSGSGKTYTCIKLMKHFDTKRYVTWTFLLCPNVNPTIRIPTRKRFMTKMVMWMKTCFLESSNTSFSKYTSFSLYLNHVVVKHRHIHNHCLIGTVVCVGIPLLIRLHTTQFAVYKTRDKTQLKQSYLTFGTTIDLEQFEHMYKEAVEEPHGYLFIHTLPKKEYMRFDVGFNHYLIVESMFKVPFKFHASKTTYSILYPCQIPKNKYSLDQKLVAEDTRYEGFKDI